jgi:hypothetical protein
MTSAAARPPNQETYLGDGLYASHDGYQVCLRADSQRVYLEPQVIEAFQNWLAPLLTPPPA